MNRNILVCFFLLLAFSFSSLSAQDSKKNWKKLVKEADEFEKLGDLLKAAQFYEEAYNSKKDKKFTYKAGKNYMEVRHYAKAVKSLEPVKGINNDAAYDKPGYFYALALKQSGQFSESRIIFESFISSYEGSDIEKMREIVEVEIQGCTYALRGSEITNTDINVSILDFNVNTDRSEYAPIPFDDNVLYFSSTVSGVSKIYRTQKNKKGDWMTRQVPTLFIGIKQKPHFGNGSFTPDGKRFFFTQCDLVEGGKSICEIYLMYEEKGNWSSPVRLPDHINLAGFNATHPQISVIDDKEVLYFASNREGGVGGMDIWYSTRNLESEIIDFTLPKNLGLNINTMGDEVCPYYNYQNKTLYFSSNGKVTIGGYDIYKSVGERTEWTEAENVGLPINSSADDLFFVVSESHGGGYFISNRLLGRDKQSTTNDDIFYYAEIKKQLLVKGSVYSQVDPTKTPLKEVQIKFYEMGLQKTLVHDKVFSLANDYKFILAAEKEYKMEVSAEGFQLYTTDISTKGVKGMESRQKDIALKPGKKEEPIVIVPLDATEENPYTLALTPPIDPATKEPYALNTEGYEKFKEAEAIAEISPTRQIYWAGNELTPLIKKEARYIVVPEEYNSASKTYELPKTIPIDVKTNKPYPLNSDVYNAYTEVNKVALQADNRRVYWNNGILEAYKEPIVEIDPRFIVVPEIYNSKDNAYELPTKIPSDKDGKPYAAGSPVFKYYVDVADKLAKTADGRKLYWDNGTLRAVEKEIAVVEVDTPVIKSEPESELDPRYVVVPEEYKSSAYSYALPRVAPIDKITNKPFAAGTKVHNEFLKAEKIAQSADGRKVYWDGEVLKAYKEPEIDPRYVVVPPQYNSENNAYQLPKILPNDPKTGKAYVAGTAVFKEFEYAKSVAKKSYNGKVFWNGDELAFVPDRTVTTAPTGQSFKVQVAAMKNLNTLKYDDLTKGDLAELTMMYEKIQNDITRVVVVPKEKNEDGTYGFKDKKEALRALKMVIDNSSFNSSFVGIYEGDLRLEGLIRLDNQSE